MGEDWKEMVREDAASTKRTLLTFLLGDAIGGLLLVGGVYLAGAILVPAGTMEFSPMFFGLLPVLVIAFVLTGLYRQQYSHPALEMPRIAALTGLIGSTAAATLYLVTGSGALALPVALWTGLGMLVMPACRGFTRVLWGQASWWGVPAVLITSEHSGRGILRTLRRWPEIGLRLVAVLTDAEDQATDAAPHGPYWLAPHLATEFDIPYAIVSMPSLTGAERANLLMRCAKFFDHVLVLPDEPSLPALWTTARSGEGLFGYSVQNTSLRPVERFVKRTVDLLGAGLVMLLLMPVLAMIAVAISRDSPGGVLYRQERMGLNGGIFTVLKFRTMYADADQKLDRILAAAPARRREYERYHKLQDDPRVTPVGRFLRRYSIDELPQIFNVLCGDMSLVGPRAYMPGELPEMNGLSRAVLQVPPGITGLWQVSGRNALSFEERLDLDVHYVQNWSAWLDLYLLVRTVPTVLSGDGAS
jgi:Undecaprenyl-phosphate galactose phosphotransferase WbaP